VYHYQRRTILTISVPELRGGTLFAELGLVGLVLLVRLMVMVRMRVSFPFLLLAFVPHCSPAVNYKGKDDRAH